ncbi:hypothetical protein PPL_11072 [Heterostelium album PN500]|uniref:Uncharacterized protein n=1 Tax=Heterostelium pallidum (strain ATCC 26659 / Pp 5 / PN500) TaxID=670386 RepID=D3BSV2_HETP5|nr:hypothetical protein PPL_11072 [Heterostelium album PN500]EFA75567.1 hypothetical protein PPL_11072 [Heterostelium album PN500]|eukprot:XP_020427701.1 hypothetical protein PPL_11072 [Heterostelium album PN500]
MNLNSIMPIIQNILIWMKNSLAIFEALKYLVALVKPLSRTKYITANFDGILCVVLHNFEKKRLNYYQALIKAPFSGDIEIVKYLNEQLDACDQSKICRDYDYETGVFFDSAAKMGRNYLIELLTDSISDYNTIDYEMISNFKSSIISGVLLNLISWLVIINPGADKNIVNEMFYLQYCLKNII